MCAPVSAHVMVDVSYDLEEQHSQCPQSALASLRSITTLRKTHTLETEMVTLTASD